MPISAPPVSSAEGEASSRSPERRSRPYLARSVARAAEIAKKEQILYNKRTNSALREEQRWRTIEIEEQMDQQRQEDGWWFGVIVTDGAPRCGLFPGLYVEKVVDQAAAAC